jgi:hypothetical protein
MLALEARKPAYSFLQETVLEFTRSLFVKSDFEEVIHGRFWELGQKKRQLDSGT